MHNSYAPCSTYLRLISADRKCTTRMAHALPTYQPTYLSTYLLPSYLSIQDAHLVFGLETCNDTYCYCSCYLFIQRPVPINPSVYFSSAFHGLAASLSDLTVSPGAEVGMGIKLLPLLKQSGTSVRDRQGGCMEGAGGSIRYGETWASLGLYAWRH
jgi:hypothetical protein